MYGTKLALTTINSWFLFLGSTVESRNANMVVQPLEEEDGNE
jgi:hypothetical protein